MLIKNWYGSDCGEAADQFGALNQALFQAPA